ncbi:hypothetical protein TEPIDINF_000694 [Tepidibacillus infernus]|uniref:Uncharacterized protein n=1 Tax=Tepidibacillus decaturensis TaxID=1413211 RepID=A0A135L2T0_9BACI|nr:MULTISPECIES: hypothetical protein [Tepidibacillus]KXG43328.1 hypothetical protein U473_04335 [Tepidibacillus decaturensis]GBF12549.1 hypothetical protein HK1_02615 [Tepidibacillus sp. HK-1]
MSERKIGKRIKFLILLIAIGSLTIYIFYIQGVFEKISLEKQETVETKVVSNDELYQIRRNQYELSDEVMLKKTRIWLAKEIQIGASRIGFNFDFMTDHPEYDLIEISFPTTKYIDDDQVIKFFSDKGVITKVHSEEGWILTY